MIRENYHTHTYLCRHAVGKIEDYIKEAKAAAANKRDRIQAKTKGLDTYEVTDQDIANFKDFVRKEKEDDINMQKEGG